MKVADIKSMVRASMRGISEAYDGLCEAGLTQMLSEVASEDCIVVSGIVNGPGNCRRADDENPAAVLAELRKCVDLGRSASDMIFMLKKVSEFENSIAAARILLEALLDELDKDR